MNPDRTWRVISVDLEGVLNGSWLISPWRTRISSPSRPVRTRSNERTITIMGEVQVPGPYEYAENETIEDLIIQAGGLTDAASTARVDVSRRIVIRRRIDL